MAMTPDKFTGLLKHAVQDSLKDTADIIVESIKQETPVQGGTLRKSIIDVQHDDKVTIEINPNSPAINYAAIVNYGDGSRQGDYFMEQGYLKAKPVKTFKRLLRAKLGQ